MRPCQWILCGGPIPEGVYGNVRYCSDPCRRAAKAEQDRNTQVRIKCKRRSMRPDGLRRGPVDVIPTKPPEWVRDLAPADRILPQQLQGLAVGGPFERIANMLIQRATQ